MIYVLTLKVSGLQAFSAVALFFDLNFAAAQNLLQLGYITILILFYYGPKIRSNM